MHDDRQVFNSVSGRIGLILTALTILWIAVAITIVSLMGVRAPATALRLWPWSSAARSAAAGILVGIPDVASARRIEALARDASGRSVIDVVAARAFGTAMLFQGRLEDSRRGLRFAEFLSRRDTSTQLWLIEDAVTRGDIAEALLHYDRALRVSLKAQSTLFPVLIAAAEQPGVRVALENTLRQRPNWWAAFISQAIGQASSPDALIPLVLALQLDVRDTSQAQIVGAALDRLIAWNQPDKAWDLNRRFWPRRPANGSVIDGSFDTPVGSGPFEWQLTGNDDLGATIEAHGGGHALMPFSQSQSGEVAHQIVRLSSGKALFSARIGGFGDGESAKARIVCLSSRQLILDLRLSFSDEAGTRVVSPINVPDHCRFAILSISYQPGQQNGHAWLDDITLTAVSNQ